MIIGLLVGKWPYLPVKWKFIFKDLRTCTFNKGACSEYHGANLPSSAAGLKKSYVNGPCQETFLQFKQTT